MLDETRIALFKVERVAIVGNNYVGFVENAPIVLHESDHSLDHAPRGDNQEGRERGHAARQAIYRRNLAYTNGYERR